MDPEVFTHEAHLRLAWIHISKYGTENALTNITSQLRTFVGFAGASHKYNQTLTVAAIKAVNHFFKKSRSNTFNDFIAEFPQLKNRFKELMQFHYTTDIFTSEKAKRELIEPDRAPFD
jgi:hypothetical protein